MTNRETLRSLADAVEALSGPCRETDALIADATMERLWFDHSYAAVREEWWQGNDGKRHYQPPAYTASTDSAMSLVGYQCGRPHNVVIATGHGSAYIVPNDGASYGVNDDLCVRGRASGDDEIGRTARAITAASLRAIGEGL